MRRRIRRCRRRAWSASPTCRSTPPTRWCAARARCSAPPTRAIRASGCRARCGANSDWPPATRSGSPRAARARCWARARTPTWPPMRCASRLGIRRPPRSARCSVRSRSKRHDVMIEQFNQYGIHLVGGAWWAVIWALIKIIVLIVPLMGFVAYLTLWERVAVGWTQVRPGPNRVGPKGLLTPIADAVKLIFKEIVRPTKASTGLFLLAPVLTIMPALVAWVVIPFGPEVAVANVNAGLLLLMTITSIEIYGIIIAGWASNSKYAFLGALRASAQMVSYEIAMGFVMVIVLMVTGSLNMSEIVASQQRGTMASLGLNFLSWNWLPLLPITVVYYVSGLAETNRAPFDVVEGESEIVAGHMIEYGGMAYAMFMLAEYANMFLVSILAVTMFFGGWASPLAVLDFIPGWIWLGLKTFFFATMFLWVRATFPRYRYDQIMRLGWKVFIPVTLVWLVVVGLWMQTPLNIWK